LIACPEYNSSITAVLKNATDWVSRPAPGESSLVAFKGKVATLLSASPGALGGLRGLVHVRSIFGNIGVIVLPEQIAVVKAHEAIKPDGSLVDPKQHAAGIFGRLSHQEWIASQLRHAKLHFGFFIPE
jgi:NAD(P)H-dependent FMN reductase